MKLFGRSNTSFIETYHNSLTKGECEILINQFEKSPQFAGLFYRGNETVEDPSVKKCV